MTISTEMLASDVPDHNKVRAVKMQGMSDAEHKKMMEDKKGKGKFKAAFMKKFGDKNKK